MINVENKKVKEVINKIHEAMLRKVKKEKSINNEIVMEMFGKIVDEANDMVILEIIDGSNNYKGYTLSEIFYIFGIDLPNGRYWRTRKDQFSFFWKPVVSSLTFASTEPIATKYIASSGITPLVFNISSKLFLISNSTRAPNPEPFFPCLFLFQLL